jgi:predicted flavoprotein YhiN
MKLFEVTNTNDNLILVLRNLISQANSKQQPSYLSWVALNKILQNIGEEEFDHDSFKIIHDSSSIIQNLVQQFDKSGVELKTTASVDKPAKQDPKKTINKMAKAAIDPKLK